MIELKKVLHYYLPYKLNVIWEINGPIHSFPLTVGIYSDHLKYERYRVKPILHHLSSLDAKYFKDNGIDLDAEIEIAELENGYRTINSMHFSVIETCLKNHIDIFGLIESGQAIKK